MKTAEDYASEAWAAQGDGLVEFFQQAMQGAREQALEEAAAILDKFQIKCFENDNKEKAFEHGLTAADIRALKNKGA